MAALAAAAARRGTRIIADEIYHGLDYGQPAHSMLEFDDNAIVINSFSKYYSMPGWRLGWIVAPPGTTEHLRAYIGSLYLTPPTLSQHAALVAMDETDVLEGYHDTYRRNRALMLDALPAMGLRPHRAARWRLLHLGRRRRFHAATAWDSATSCSPIPASPSRPASISTPSTATASCAFPSRSARIVPRKRCSGWATGWRNAEIQAFSASFTPGGACTRRRRTMRGSPSMTSKRQPLG